MNPLYPTVTQFETRRRRLEQELRLLGPRTARSRWPLGWLSKHDLATLTRFSQVVEVPAGRRLIAQGEFPNEFFVIEEGSARVERDDRPLAELGPGDFFGEIALLQDDTRTATVVAYSDMRLRVVHRSEFARLLRAIPALADHTREATGERLLLQAVTAPA